MTTPPEPCRTCRGTGLIETAAQDSRVLTYEVCPDGDVIQYEPSGHGAGPAPAVAAQEAALVTALRDEYADVLARRGAYEKPAILGQAEQYCYLHGVCNALERVAERLGITDLHDQAADVVARGSGEREEGP